MTKKGIYTEGSSSLEKLNFKNGKNIKKHLKIGHFTQ
jgi:hypothetical protein